MPALQSTCHSEERTHLAGNRQSGSDFGSLAERGSTARALPRLFEIPIRISKGLRGENPSSIFLTAGGKIIGAKTMLASSQSRC
jgi:hypothetical protein